MPDHDLVHRFIFDNTDIRGEIVTLENSYREATAHQAFPPTLRPLLGEFLAAAALLAQVLKFEGVLTLQARGDGDVALAMAEATHTGELRGIINLSEVAQRQPAEYFAGKSLPQLLGKAALAITIDPNQGRRYQGIVPLDADQLAPCLMHYFGQSEQLPTQVQLYADEHRCGGLFLQCLPAQVVLDPAEREQHWQTALHLGATLSAVELFELEQREVLLRLFHELQCRLFDPQPLRFHCGCTPERSANAIRALAAAEAYALLHERGAITIDCQFCGQHYTFGNEDLDAIFSTSAVLH